jgi:hypothetical protein
MKQEEPAVGRIQNASRPVDHEWSQRAGQWGVYLRVF